MASLAKSVCAWCQTAYVPKASNRTTCCSRECGFAWQAFNRSAHIPLSYGVYRPICLGCGKRFTAPHKGKLYCTIECRPKPQSVVYQPKPFVARSFDCRECGRQHTTSEAGRHSTKFCGTTCQRKHWKRGARIAGKARKRVATVETVNPLKVFDRDGWRCHLCGTVTPRRLRGTYEPRAPELDHIVPLSKGGDHSYLNTACACRQCNIAKSDSVKGQLRLIG